MRYDAGRQAARVRIMGRSHLSHAVRQTAMRVGTVPSIRRTSLRPSAVAALLAAATVLTSGILPAVAADAPRARIAAALRQWMADFNARRADRVCDLFARDLRVDFRGQPERGYAATCRLLKRSLADRTRRYSYALKIKEILVEGDIAIVRLTWTLTVRPRGGGRPTVSVEPGLDVFRRQADGRWRIVRYMAYAR
jgi:uncharacterized protein (TIGR02246 family)